MGPSVLPDLRYLGQAEHKAFSNIVLGGILSSGGMASFKDILDQKQVNKLHSYLIEMQRQAYAAQATRVTKH